MKFFDKTLDEIYEIISEVNDELSYCLPQKERDWFIGITFEFNGWVGMVKFMDECLLSTETQVLIYYDDIDEYEDLRDAIKRCIKEQIDYYSQFKSVCDVEN